MSCLSLQEIPMSHILRCYKMLHIFLVCCRNAGCNSEVSHVMVHVSNTPEGGIFRHWTE
ncbi:hypothetical protein BX666DRAFT_1957864 [Dichotomocladium elegans]|nr:hypothetical protein BX666DRAFT_1957864 [Dichotomocladium elegans]